MADTTGTPSAADATFCPAGARRFVLTAAILASALGFIDGSVVAIAMPAIRADIGATLQQAQDISNAYMLTLSALILVGGAAGDRFGLRRVFAIGIGVFVALSAVCAAAPGPLILIAARALQGIGAAFMVPGSLAIIAKAYPKAQRGRAIGIWAAASALTTALGPLLGGFVLSVFGDGAWRAIFAINLPLGGIALALLLARVPADAAGGRRPLDLVGAALATSGLGLLAYALTAAGGEEAEPGWIAACCVAAAAVFAAFLFWEARRRDPMVDLSLFRNRSFSGANAATLCLYFALSAVMFYLPMLLVAGWGLGEGAAGFVFLPLSAVIALLSGPAGTAADRIGPRLPIASGSLTAGLALAGLAALAGAGAHRFWSGVLPLMGLLGLGMALVVSPLSTAVMTAVEDRDTGAASGINNAVSRVAGLLAVAAMGGVAAMRYADVLALRGMLSPPLPGYGEKPAEMLAAEFEPARVAASDAAFSAVAWIAAALCVLAALIALATVAGRGTGARQGLKTD